MNRQNFIKHLALAVIILLVAAFVGQLRRMNHNWRTARPRLGPYVWQNEPRKETAVEVDEQQARVLVRFKPGTSLRDVASIAGSHHDILKDEIESVNGLTIIEDEDGLDAESVAKEYRALGMVEYAEASYEIKLEPELGNVTHYDASAELAGPLSNNGPNDPMFASQWSLSNTGQNGGKEGADINALRAWNKTRGSESVVVAVLDSGVDYTHLDLIGNIWVRPPNIAEYTDDELGSFDDRNGFSAIGDDPMDDNGHGTHCAGIIGAEGDNEKGITGINWKVEIMPLKFMDANGSGTTADAIKAINYVIERKRAGVNVRIISASWGSTMRSRALEDAIRKAGEEDILFVAASGNSSADTDQQPHYPSSYNLPNIISVAALDRKDMLASFSNYGAKSVHVAAPGAEILSTWPHDSFEEHSGTSMATPEVVGVAALLLSIEPNLSVKELRERIFKSVDQLETLKGKVSTGGRINAARAVGAD
ncbi:MAG TPA: S8 family serine peptidase [Pyrinomonadaceae bacterium]|jgi:subtilisin family serine protease